MSTSRDPTPPNHPAFELHISDDTITALLRHYLPACKISHIDRIPHTRSYNNRIFIIHFLDEPTGTPQQPPCVLKVNGRFFGPAKVENEAACLLLLNRYCPQLAVPRVLAWSTDGVCMARRSEDGVLIESRLGHTLHTQPRQWILMTHLPGVPLNTRTLSTADVGSLVGQIARMIKYWRQDIRPAHCAANLHFTPRTASSGARDLYRGEAPALPEMYIYGNTGSGNDHGESAHTLLDYWHNELEWQRTQLATKPAFQANRRLLLDDLDTFIEHTLPKLPLFQIPRTPNPFIFTHTDLSPRNILVSPDTPVRVTGIVDFEFSGFFPWMEEFVKDWDPPDPSSDDDSQWPGEMHEMIVMELERLGEPTSRRLGARERSVLRNLNAVRYHIAPWWIEQGMDDAESGLEERRRELEKARLEVESAITRLEAIVEDGEAGR